MRQHLLLLLRKCRGDQKRGGRRYRTSETRLNGIYEIKGLLIAIAALMASSAVNAVEVSLDGKGVTRRDEQ